MGVLSPARVTQLSLHAATEAGVVSGVTVQKGKLRQQGTPWLRTALLVSGVGRAGLGVSLGFAL